MTQPEESWRDLTKRYVKEMLTKIHNRRTHAPSGMVSLPVPLQEAVPAELQTPSGRAQAAKLDPTLLKLGLVALLGVGGVLGLIMAMEKRPPDSPESSPTGKTLPPQRETPSIASQGSHPTSGVAASASVLPPKTPSNPSFVSADPESSQPPSVPSEKMARLLEQIDALAARADELPSEELQKAVESLWAQYEVDNP
jgi:hypothetical protein